MIRRLSRHPRALLALAVLLVLLLAGWHYWTIVSSLTGARDDLRGAGSILREGGLDLTAADVERVRERFANARSGLRRGRTHLSRDPLLFLARLAPAARAQIEALDQVVEMGETVTEAGLLATHMADKAVRLRDDPPDGEGLPAAMVGLLAGIEPEMDRLVALVAELVAARLELGDGPLLPPLDSARRLIDEELPAAASALELLDQARTFAPAFLGFEGERRYLVLALNENELLPGGGLVTAAGMMTISEGALGQIGIRNTGGWTSLWLHQGNPHIEPPGPLQRYLLKYYPWNLVVANWSPHFPTWGAQALEFYELVHGDQDADGVIALNLQVLVSILDVIGPKTIDVPGREPVTLTPENAHLELLRLTRRSSVKGEDDRKAIIGTLGSELIDDLLALPAEKWVSALEILRLISERRFIQVLALDPGEQALIRHLGLDGSIEAPAGDYLQINEASLNSTKLNLIIKPEGTYTVDISEIGDARHELTLTYRNPLPEWRSGKDHHLVSVLMLGGLYGGYLRIFAPLGTTAFSAEVDGVPAALEDRGREAGKDWFGTFLSLPAGVERSVTLRWAVPLAMASAGARSYDLYLQRQHGAHPHCLALTVTLAGEPAQTLEIDGGRIDSQGRLCLETDTRVHATW